MKFYVDSLKNVSDKNCVVLEKDDWDDWFRFETKYYAYYFDDTGERIDLGGVKIGQVNMKEGQRTASIPSKFYELSEDYFSLGQSDYYYENIKNLGDQVRQDILNGLNDVAYDLTRFKNIKNLDVTKVSLMREISEFTITQQFYRIAQGKARLTEHNIEYTYPPQYMDEPPTLSFKVVPNSNPPTNIHVIIGRNNVGKTYLIKSIIKSVYAESGEYEYGRLRSSNSLTGRMNLANRKQAFANILCVSFSPFDNYNDVKKFTNDKPTMPFQYIGLGNTNISETLNESFVNSLLHCQKSERKIELLLKAIEVLETDPIFERSNIRSLIKITKDNMDENFRVEASELFKKLSSGHQVIILTLTRLIECIVEKSLVILDEPENHLHPPLLSAFIRALSDLLIDQNGVALIATHSPVILQEVPRSCVWKINRNGFKVTISRLDIESFGSTIGALTREVFGLEVSKSGFHKMIEDEVNSGKSYDEIIECFNNELGDEARALLSTLIMLKQ